MRRRRWAAGSSARHYAVPIKQCISSAALLPPCFPLETCACVPARMASAGLEAHLSPGCRMRRLAASSMKPARDDLTRTAARSNGGQVGGAVREHATPWSRRLREELTLPDPRAPMTCTQSGASSASISPAHALVVQHSSCLSGKSSCPPLSKCTCSARLGVIVNSCLRNSDASGWAGGGRQMANLASSDAPFDHALHDGLLRLVCRSDPV